MGFTPASFAGRSLDAAASEIVVVRGPRNIAECAAHLRDDCPADLSSYILRASTSFVEDTDATPALKRQYGTDGAIVTLGFEPVPTSKFGTTYTPPATDGSGNDLVYVVQTHDTATGTASGDILAAAHLAPSEETVISKSDGVDKISALVVDVPAPTSPPAVGTSCGADPPGYCLSTISPNKIIPLGNTLKPGSSADDASWKYYVNAAKQAADRADEIGRRAIEEFGRAEDRLEASGEALAEVCGEYGGAGQISYANGKVTAPYNAALAACLDEASVDVVFLTEDPVPPNGSTATLVDVLDCKGIGKTNPLCKDVAALSHAGLGLAPFISQEAASSVNCSAINGVVDTFVGTGVVDVRPFQGHPFVQTNALSMVAGNLRLSEDEAGRWTLKYGSDLVMSSEASSGLWPGCVRGGAKACEDGRAAIFSKMFRLGATHAAPCDPSTERLVTTPTAELCVPWLVGTGETGFETDAMALRTIFWRLQGALWTLGGMAGEVNPLMFSVNVPVADFDQVTLAPAQTVYWPGKLAASGTSYLLATGEPALAAAMTPIHDIPMPWLSTTIDVPQWIQNIYAFNGDPVAGKYKHFRATYHGHSGNLTQPLSEMWSTVVSPLLSTNCAGAFHGGGDDATVRAAMTGLKKHPILCTESNLGSDLAHGHCASPTPVPLMVLDEGCPTHGRTGDNNWDQCGTVAELSDNGAENFNCNAVVAGGITRVSANCAAGAPLEGDYMVGQKKWHASYFFPSLVRADRCKPSDRVPAFVNSRPPTSTCGAGTQLMQAVALACNVAGSSLSTASPQAPAITNLDQVPRLQAWLEQEAVRARQQLSRLRLEHLPKRVVSDFQANKIGTGAVAGRHGALLLELEQSIQGIVQGWIQITKDLALLSEAIRTANLQVRAVDLSQKKETAQVAVQTFALHAQVAQALGSAISSMGQLTNPVGGEFALAGSAVSLGGVLEATKAQQAELAKISLLNAEGAMNSIAIALNELQKSTQSLYADLESALSSTRSATAASLSLAHQLRQSSATARYAAAKGAAQPFVTVDGKAVGLPVNTVLRRQALADAVRYQRSLGEAKELACYARMAIEQRIGRRLTDLKSVVGTEVPATWADDVGKMTGIDYVALRSAYVPGQPGMPQLPAGVTPDQANVLADAIVIEATQRQYIGDYVARLDNFMTFYDVKNPTATGEDAVVLSLAQDILPEASGCLKEAPNLLYFSGRLYDVDVSSDGTVRGWQRSGCNAGSEACATPVANEALTPPAVAPVTSKDPSVTWLRREMQTPDANVMPPAGMSEAVWQEVDLPPGTYSLSWWDQARDASGALVASDSQGYFGGVLDETGGPIAFYPFVSKGVSAPDAWSERRVVTFTLGSPQKVRVAFRVNLGAGVALADVQLERTPGSSYGPTAYIPTSASRQYLAGSGCVASPSTMRAAFAYVPSRGYSLSKPMHFLVSAFGKKSPFHFGRKRLRSFAINLVGTGVHDCSDNPSAGCYAAGYEMARLAHDAGSVVLEGGKPFNFGLVTVQTKALAAERVLTMPLGSSDQSLISQLGIERADLEGRPLEGNYDLLIVDSPSLHWDRVEDIQIVVKYRFDNAVGEQ